MTLAWPALDGPLKGLLRIERGVWGKAHGARSDFRWLAQSAAFGEGTGGGELGRKLNLGLEDRPEKLVAWRMGDHGTASAVAAYPSRAADAAGRRGFLEKQILVWRPLDALPDRVPAAAAAFLLLETAASFDDRIWWDRQDGARWSDPAFVLPIPAPGHPPVALSERALADAVAAGIDELSRSGISEDELARFYTALLAGERPAKLGGVAAPLPPRALAALLLPLPREHADALSLLGGLPSSRGDLEELGQRFDGVVLPRGRELGDREVTPRARRLAVALLAGDPERLPDPREEFDEETWTARMQRDLSGTTGELIRSGLWPRWRDEVHLPPQERLTTALAWMSSPAWCEDGVSPPEYALWERALDDVATLSRPRVKRLCGGPGGRPAWPWIPGREHDQIDDLRAMTRSDEERRLLEAALAKGDRNEPTASPELAEPATS